MRSHLSRPTVGNTFVFMLLSSAARSNLRVELTSNHGVATVFSTVKNTGVDP